MKDIVSEDLQKVGTRGCYQILLGIMFFLLGAEINMLIFGPTFIFMTPTFTCTFAEGIVDQSSACPRIDQCFITSDFSIVAALELYCDKQHHRTLIQSISAAGAIVGVLSVSYISDIRGRRFNMLFSQLIGILSVCLIIIGAYIKSVATLIISQFISGYAAYTLVIPLYVMTGQYCDDVIRQNMVIVISYAWYRYNRYRAIIKIIIGIAYFVYNWWYNFMILFVLAPFILIFAFTYFILVESPTFLYRNGLEQQYIKTLKTIAYYNKMAFDEKNIAHIQNTVEEGDFLQMEYLYQAVCNQYNCKIIILLGLAEIGIYVYYSGANYALDIVGWGYGYNCILGGVLELVAYLCLQLVVTKLPRRYGMIGSCGLMAILGLIFIFPSVVKSIATQIVVIGFDRFIGTFVYTILMVYLTELFPSHVSATCMGIVQSIAQIGNILAPIVVTFCINNQIYPLVLFSFAIIIFILIPLSLIDDSRTARQIQKARIANGRQLIQ